jgi:hypothetical protein
MAKFTKGYALMTTLVERFKAAYGKSHGDYQGRYNGPFRLNDHVIDAVHACVHIFNHLDIEAYDRHKADVLAVATYLHDLGKLDDNFQKMLAFRHEHPTDSIAGTGIKIVKHEASTFDFTESVTQADIEAVCVMIEDETGYRTDPHTFTDPQVLADVWGFAASHHGLFYVSYEVRQGQTESIPRIRRTWTTFNPGEVGRLTFVDLLLRYHPLGGIVTACDLIASASQNNQICIKDLLQPFTTLTDFIRFILEPMQLKKVESSIQRDNGKDYFLEGILRLLLGGITPIQPNSDQTGGVFNGK